MERDEREAAERTERALREQIADLVRAKARAEDEARRLDGRGVANPALAEVAGRYRGQAERLGAEIEGLRHTLREQEAQVERLRADEAGA